MGDYTFRSEPAPCEERRAIPVRLKAGVPGADGKDGKDGYSPTVTLERIEDTSGGLVLEDETGNRWCFLEGAGTGDDITITDGAGNLWHMPSGTASGGEIPVTDGTGSWRIPTGGGSGRSGTRVNITDKTGEHVYYVWDGRDGEDGAPGQPGRDGEDGAPGQPGRDGATGPAGKSAYESAQDGGYSGTEAQFETDLAGVSGKQPTITASGLLKGDGQGGVSAAVAGTDYVPPSALAPYRTAAAQDTIDALLGSTIPGTTQTVTFDANDKPVSIVHTADNAAVRTDVFTWGTNSVTELRTLANGKHITMTTNLQTLVTVISDIQEAV